MEDTVSAFVLGWMWSKEVFFTKFYMYSELLNEQETLSSHVLAITDLSACTCIHICLHYSGLSVDND